MVRQINETQPRRADLPLGCRVGSLYCRPSLQAWSGGATYAKEKEMSAETNATVSHSLKPPIALSVRDFEQLSTLARAAEARMPDVAMQLSEELERAYIVPPGEAADRHVQMGSDVEFRDETTGRVQRIVLVYPDQADISRARVSVLTPIGAALIGLGVGDSIEWNTRTGEVRRLTVLRVGAP
jgi:regulator of nucleoside diphosphate kinase